ncbi:MAG: phytanoyl-CoA dioxygenase family protein [Calothrix sp. FI2-JRJ7]|jgi:phytanoyl-CoA hydroxylase|nr:phytanoyl-CoA dioxygenase family protein [Calothrix sp. FI2-JRJ7]
MIINATATSINITSLFQEQGYFLAKRLLSKSICLELKNAFLSEVKTCTKPLLRQRNVEYETHRFSSSGFMNNPLLDVHNYNCNAFPKFYCSFNTLFTCQSMYDFIKNFLNGEPVFLQSMYFESSRGTTTHYDHSFIKVSNQDTHILPIPIIGIWIALEDIEDSSGKFFVYPQSHKIGTSKYNTKTNELFAKYSQYCAESIDKGYNKGLRSVIQTENLLKEVISIAKWEKYYPNMETGDVLFFSGLILHGSDRPVNSAKTSRNSITAHFAPYKEGQEIKFGLHGEPLKVSTHVGNFLSHKTHRYPPFRQNLA